MNQGDKKEMPLWDFRNIPYRTNSQAYTSGGEPPLGNLTWVDSARAYMTSMSPGLDRWRLENLERSRSENWSNSFRSRSTASPGPGFNFSLNAHATKKHPTRYHEFDKGKSQIGSSSNTAKLGVLEEHEGSINDACSERDAITRRTTYLERDPRRNSHLHFRNFTSERLEERNITEKEPQEANKPQEDCPSMASNNDVRAMALFKFQLVEFIKVLLSPTWKEGRLSKENYKQIVKKVADKVVASIEAPYIPRTQQNIDQYLSLSESKIAKLVQAYVERFQRSETRS